MRAILGLFLALLLVGPVRAQYLDPSCGVSDQQVALFTPEAGGVEALPAAVTGVQRVAAFLVNFHDYPVRPFTVEVVHAELGVVDAFIRENSSGVVSLASDVYGWYTLAMDSTPCNHGQISTLTKQAALAAGVNLSSYSRLIFLFPGIACPWAGLGTIGGSPSESWINGGPSPATMNHELGHNFGLLHSNALECGSVTLGPSCVPVEYGDHFCTMGGRATGQYNAVQKETLGWITPQVVTAPGTYVLAPYETPRGETLQALKVQTVNRVTGAPVTYYVEYRQPLGADTYLAENPTVPYGVLLHAGPEGAQRNPLILDATGATDSWTDPALVVGQIFTDPAVGVSMWVESVNSSGATVTVDVQSPPPPPPPTTPPPTRGLTVRVTPTRMQYARGDTAVITVTVRQDGFPVAGAKVTMQVTRASGVVVRRRHPTTADGVFTTRVLIPLKDTPGTYRIDVQAKQGAQTVTTPASFMVH